MINITEEAFYFLIVANAILGIIGFVSIKYIDWDKREDIQLHNVFALMFFYLRLFDGTCRHIYPR